MYVHFKFSEIYTVSSLNSKIENQSTEFGNLPCTLYNFNSILNWEPKKGALNVVWFLSSCISAVIKLKEEGTPEDAKWANEYLTFITSLCCINSMLIRYIQASIKYTMVICLFLICFIRFSM